MELFIQYQPDIMLILSSICGIQALHIFMTNSISKKRKWILIMLELGAMLMQIAERHYYIFRGDMSRLGWWMVRISNFLIFFLTLFVIYCFNLYLIDLYLNEGRLETVPKRLKLVNILSFIGIGIVIISQFTGFYYTFDEMNRYQRSPGFIVCYLIPMTILFLQISVILHYYSRLSHGISISLLLFACFSIITSVMQLFLYGISLNSMTVAFMASLIYIFFLKDLSREVERARTLEIEHYKEEQQKEHSLFEQTTEALATAIDAKDRYTHGHSTRVAIYSTQIAKEAGKSKEECEKVYFAALLHDVGKIGVADSIINKSGKLTDDEFKQIKLHPVYGNQILSSIQLSPYLSIGAHHHHERYDGRGYPDGLKGDDIPDIARIISVADAYDAMTSKRSYRDPIPQQKVREELVKGMGTQFDPDYAKIMLHLLDLDIEYNMREMETGMDESFLNQIECEKIYHECSLGIHVNEKIARIRFRSTPDPGFPEDNSLPTLIIFDALDARVHLEEAKINDLLYFEYGQIRLDGKVISKGARKIECNLIPKKNRTDSTAYSNYIVEAVRVRDHALIRIMDAKQTIECIIALPDNSRFTYISLTGEHCKISNISINREENSVEAGYIPRIAEEISFIKGCPQGDIPNVEIDGWRTSNSIGVPITDSLIIRFHTKSLPTARLVWHCPFVSIFSSDDGTVDGSGFREFLLLRLDGENWESDSHAENEVHINHTSSFPGWNAWKTVNKEGMDCEVFIHRQGNVITVKTINQGIQLDSVTTIKDEVTNLYAALSGDQVALTDIRISRE